MFRSFIYLDKEKMYTYLRQIDKEFKVQTTEISKRKLRGGCINVPAFGINAETEIEEQRNIIKDQFNDYDRFEKCLDQLEGGEYFDFVLSSDYDFSTVPKMSIIRINGSFEIPEQFDMYSVAQAFMPLITSQIQTSSDDEKELLETFLGKASADIPILIIDDEITISGKLNTSFLLESYTELEEYCEQDVYMLCKVVGIMKKPQVEIFNPLKDFIKLPRAVRRGMEKPDTKKLESIIVDGPVLKVEIIGIYK